MAAYLLFYAKIAAIILPIAAPLLYMMWMPGRSSLLKAGEGEVSQEEKAVQERLTSHVRMLSEEIGPRSMFQREGLARAERFISGQWTTYGYNVLRQRVTENPDTWNLYVEKKGTVFPGTVVVVGAHYDTVPPACPGANDNGSGVAALLVLSELLKDFKPRHTIRFVAFVNEEPPHFQKETMGSYVFAAEARKAGEQISAMLSLETIGYYTNEPGTQRYPFPISLFYPDRGNFIGFVGDLSSAALVRKSIKLFRRSARVASAGITAPSSIPGVGWSDQWSFWEHGFPGIMVTDTAPFRYPHYHEDSDTWEKLEYQTFTRVVLGLRPVVEGLCS